MIALAILLSGAASADPDWNCADPGPQQEMNYCAAQEYRKADVALNAQWKRTAAHMKQRDAGQDSGDENPPEHFASLLAAQRAWITYRDAHCQTAGHLFYGGTMEPLIVSTCKTGLTQERTHQLKLLIEP